MADAVRLSVDDFQGIYEQSFRAWSTLHHAAIERPGIPPSYLDIQNAFRQHPSFPNDLRLEHVKYAKHSRVYATGRSTWGSTQPDCGNGLPPFSQQVQIGVILKGPIPLSIAAAMPKREIHWASWFTRGDENYLGILILAWAYVLSARWAEIMSEATSLVYTSSKAEDSTPGVQTTPLPDHLSLEVDISDASPDEARWWAAVLAPGQGWEATMLLGQDTFFAPWSIRLQPGHRFILSTNPTFRNHSAGAPSSSEALRFLSNFCVRRNIGDQSQAALAAVLLFPSMGIGQGLELPAFTSSRLNLPTAVASSVLQRQCPDLDGEQRYGWVHQEGHLDRLIPLSCYTKGIRPMLLSSFYDPSIECNAVTPWLQGALAVIDVVAEDDPLVLGRLLMDRQPKVAPLWLGITVLGLQKKVLQDVRFGLIPVDLHSAVWSGAIQSFIQQPVSDPLVADDQVARADQCRLLFLSRSGSHDRVPVCQWRPFGGTPLEHTDIEVRVHAECKGHGLRYQGLTWDCVGEKTAHQPLDGDDLYAYQSPPRTAQTSYSRQTLVNYGNLDHEKDFVSENATRSVFGWLRVYGYALGEKPIWKHEWFEMSESDEEVEEGVKTVLVTCTSLPHTWRLGFLNYLTGPDDDVIAQRASNASRILLRALCVFPAVIQDTKPKHTTYRLAIGRGKKLGASSDTLNNVAVICRWLKRLRYGRSRRPTTPSPPPAAVRCSWTKAGSCRPQPDT